MNSKFFNMIPNFHLQQAVIVLFVSLFCLNAWADTPGKTGQTAPDFQLKTLSGDTVQLSRLVRRGPVMLVFYETQCVYCFSHISEFNALHDRYHDKGLTILAINYVGEYLTDIRNYARDNGLKYTVITDKIASIDVAEAYHVVGSPTIVVVDTHGKIVFYGYRLPPDISKWLRT
ncbi:MAG: TlpA disulfide reductase family protein [Gammaproteobacteria bacterium]|jgi:peroxiredoxin